MAVTGFALIEDTLFSHLATLTTSPVTTFAWPNRPHSGNVPRIEVQHVANNAFGGSIDRGTDQPGLLVLTAVVESGTGTGVLTDLAAQIIAHFDRRQFVNSEWRIRITNTPSPSQPIPDGGETRLPVTVAYIATN